MLKDHIRQRVTQSINGIDVDIYDTVTSGKELAKILRPLILQVYNQLPVPSLAISRAGIPRIEKFLTSTVPGTQNLKKAEFGETLATLFIEQILGRPVPVYKHSHKTSSNMPVHGMDCVSISVEGEQGNERIRIYFYEVKTTESTTKYPSVCYEIRDAFTDLNAEIFDSECAFIWRQLSKKTSLSSEEALIVELLGSVDYGEAELLFGPFLVSDESYYQDTFLIPFCSPSYTRPIEPVVVRIKKMDQIYNLVMRSSDA